MNGTQHCPAPAADFAPALQPGAARRQARQAAGATYYRLPDTPEGCHIKEYASGLRQLVRFVGVEEQVIKFSIA